MSETTTAADVEVSRSPPAQSPLRRRGDRRRAHLARAHAKHRGRRLRVLVAVPILDWPADLFSDSASIGDLVAEDFPLPPHIAAALSGYENHTTH
jgi:hypothetical protein